MRLPLAVACAAIVALASGASTVCAQTLPSLRQLEDAVRELRKQLEKLPPDQPPAPDEAQRQAQPKPQPGSSGETPNRGEAAPTSAVEAAPSQPALAPIQPVFAPKPPAQPIASGPRDSVRSYYDDHVLDVEPSIAGFIASNRGLVGGKARAVSTAEALAVARSLLGRDPEAVLRKARSLPGAKTPAGLGTHMLGLLVQRRFTEALGVALAAHAMNPASPSAQFNVATLLYTLGSPNEALALYDDLQRRRLAPTSAWWKDPANALDHARAMSLLSTGRPAQARSLLERIAAAEPHLSEAALALALLDAEEKRDPRRTLVLGSWRTRDKPMVCATDGKWSAATDPFATGDEIAMPFEILLDFGRGSDGVLPAVPLPSAAWVPAARAEKIAARRRVEDAELAGLHKRKAELWAKVQKYTHEPFVADTREYRLFQTLAQPLYHSPRILERDLEVDLARMAALESLDKNRFASDREQHAIEMRILEDARGLKDPPPSEVLIRKGCDPRRTVVSSYLQRHLPAARNFDQTLRDRFRDWHRYATVLAGEISDPAWHEVFRLEIEIERRRHTKQLLNEAQALARWASDGRQMCDMPPDGADVGAQESSDVPICSDEQARHSVGIDIGETPAGSLIGLEFNCTGASVELNIPLAPLLGVSAELGVDVKGEVTVFVGPKASTPDVLGPSGSIKTGAYVKVGSEGLRDVGAKGEVKAGAKATPAVSSSYKVDEIEFTLMPSPNSPPPPSGAPTWLGSFPST